MYRATNQRNRHKKSVGSDGGGSVGNVIEGLCPSGFHIHFNSCSNSLLFLISMVAQLYLSHGNWLGGFRNAGIGAMGITLLTVSFQAIKAAMANPIESLKDE